METAAAAAKSLQSYLTLCDPRDGSPPGSPVPGILQARTLEWVAISFSNAWKWKVKAKSLSRARLKGYIFQLSFPDDSDSKESACNAEDPGSVPGSRRSPGERNGNHSSILAWRTPWIEEPSRLQKVYADDTTLMAESEEELKSFFKRWEYQTTWPASWGICMQVKKQQ